jgi:hypothetical protein
MLKATINPVLFLVFNRLDTTRQVFDIIRQARPNKLYVAADGARQNLIDELEKVKLVRDYIISNIDWPCEIKTLFRTENLGCKIAISSALDWFFQNEKQGIILEDDCLPDISFFQFCDELLEKYKNDQSVAMIGGNNFNTKKIGTADYYFSKIPHIWGWATWRRTWQKYDISMSTYSDFKEKNLIKNIWPDKKVQNYWINILDEVYNNKVNTWDYQFTFSIFLEKGLCINPNKNLVSNIGFQKNFTNTLLTDKRVANLALERISLPIQHPENIEYNIKNDENINSIYLRYYKTKKIFKKIGVFSFVKKVYIKLQSMIK